MFAKLSDRQFQGAIYSLALHLFFVCVYLLLTYTPKYENIDFDLTGNIGSFAHPKKHMQKKISITDMEKQDETTAIPENKDTTEDSADTDEISELDSADDLSFHPDAISPRPITRLKRIYPESARQKEVEAMAYVSIVIASDGRILAINVNGVKLKKNVSPDVDNQLKKEFALAARDILKDVRFTPAIVKGKRIPVIMDIPLNFTLN